MVFITGAAVWGPCRAALPPYCSQMRTRPRSSELSQWLDYVPNLPRGPLR
jgi:hypothetical protein